MWPSGGVAPNEPAVLEFVQPPLHRLPAQPPVKDRCVTQDVVEVFDRRVRDGLVLMERVRAAHPAHRYAAGGGALREIGILAAISAMSSQNPPMCSQVAALTANDSDQNIP